MEGLELRKLASLKRAHCLIEVRNFLMKKPVTFASSFRVKAALCCSVAVLLTACGGTTDEFANQQLLADTVITDPTEASRARTTGAIDAGPATPEPIAQVEVGW